jgi:uncharacterized membrane protein YqjE
VTAAGLQRVDPSTYDVDLHTQPREPDKSLGDLVADLTESVSTIFRKEVELAKEEIKQEASTAGKGAAMLGGAGLAGWFALLLLSFALAYWLNEALHVAVAFLLVGLLWSAAAAVLYMTGRKALSKVETLPQTMESLKEDAAWVRAQRT